MTELDHTVLALIARDGPLSAYDVRKDFAQSVTPTWSSSTGSIYPSIRRLVNEGLIQASAPEGGRAKQQLRITRKGRGALSKWLSALTVKIAAATPDPIRTRSHFLRLLDEKGRRKFLAEARKQTEAALAIAERRHQARVAAKASKLEYLPSTGVLYELRARRDWLDLLARELK
jgi:DNA-binding PadR family transcriptional regulator